MELSNEDLEIGWEYQDFISIQLLRQLGWSINQFVSRKYQVEVGESLAGIEIKNDRKMADTGNLYIELEELACNGKFVPSGINREDNALMWCIGDYKSAYILVKKQLKYLCEHYERFGFKKVETETSRGILIPVKFLEENDIYVVKKINF